VVVVLGQRNCNTLQHTATKCNTLQHTVDGIDVAVGLGQLGPNDNWCVHTATHTATHTAAYTAAHTATHAATHTAVAVGLRQLGPKR